MHRVCVRTAFARNSVDASNVIPDVPEGTWQRLCHVDFLRRPATTVCHSCLMYRLAGGVFRRHLVQVLAQQCNHARAKRGAAPCLCRQVSVAHVMQKPVARAVLHVDPVQVKNLQKHSSAVLSVSE